jgi:hypothetical protein
MSLNKDEKDVSIQDLYSEVVDNDSRNQQIVEDVFASYKRGRNCIVLTLRTAHVELLVKKSRKEVPDVTMLMGGIW